MEIVSYPTFQPTEVFQYRLNISTINDTGNASITIDFDTNRYNFDLSLRYSISVTICLCVAYSAVFLIGITGNSFVVSVVYRNKKMRNPMNVFIANLACADLLVNVLCLPFTLIGNIMNAWVLGWFICKTVPYLQGVSVTASVYTLVTISMERCLAICYPMTWQMTSRACRRIVVVIWLFSMTVTSPWAVYFQLIPFEYESDSQMVCTELWPSVESGTIYFIVAQLTLCYLLPLFIITVCYHVIWRRVSHRAIPSDHDGAIQLMIHRSKVKVVKMLFYVVLLFAFSWLPLYTIVCWTKFSPAATTPDLIYSLIPFAQWLGVSNSSINPILYAFLNRKFRSGFRAIIQSGSCCSPIQSGHYNGRNSTVRSLKVNEVNNRLYVHHNKMAAAAAVAKTRVNVEGYGTIIQMNCFNNGTKV